MSPAVSSVVASRLIAANMADGAAVFGVAVALLAVLPPPPLEPPAAPITLWAMTWSCSDFSVLTGEKQTAICDGSDQRALHRAANHWRALLSRKMGMSGISSAARASASARLSPSSYSRIAARSSKSEVSDKASSPTSCPCGKSATSGTSATLRQLDASRRCPPRPTLAGCTGGPGWFPSKACPLH